MEGYLKSQSLVFQDLMVQFMDGRQHEIVIKKLIQIEKNGEIEI